MVKKNTIHKLVASLKKELNFSIINLEISFINSSEIIRINSKYLKHNYSTDVLTFDYSKSKLELDGEVLISYIDAKENSKKFGTLFKEELIRLVIHGILHLLGYNDLDRTDRKIMKTTEEFLFDKFRSLAIEE